MTTRLVAIAVASLFISAVRVRSDDQNHVYSPCEDATVQRWDGFSFGVAFASLDSFSSGGTQYSPCDSRLSLQSKNAQLALFRPKVDEISLLTVNASTGFDPINSGGHMVAFAGRKYAARSKPIFVGNSSYVVTGFTLVLEFKKGQLQNLYWKTNGCSSCSGGNFVCLEKTTCALKSSSCKSQGGQVDCSVGIQVAFSGSDRHDAVLNSWYEVSNMNQYSLFGLYSDLKGSLTSQFNNFF
ncbi:Expp1 protein [Rhynchospora pubera]|uniref:Expp1 protein n=1 Tax=Rhynchospora pubera TaxID=906938 RepID=A0AAV8G3A3_9POAL|nr:Expp1 protein [Rhynchospora pubera]KAJ4800113.1 Expp1 protein [Rhynchospora pubera]KAJ4811343.1 Expp1 protein [Rhynchospora pubera]